MLHVELLVIPECPHEAEASRLVLSALADVGVRCFSVTTSVIADEREAVQRGFVGSPTILLNGVDPFAVPSAPIVMGCRMYATPSGLAGTPTLSDVRQALKRAADRAG